MTSSRSGQPVRVVLNSVDRPGEVVCMTDDQNVRVRIAGVSRDYPVDLVSPLKSDRPDRWAELHGGAR